jgi:hypothetical protein
MADRNYPENALEMKPVAPVVEGRAASSQSRVPILPLSYGDYLPNKDNFESAYRMLCSPGQKIDKESILNQIDKNAINSGYNLKKNWRMITEKNI